jgi:cytochrome c
VIAAKGLDHRSVAGFLAAIAIMGLAALIPTLCFARPDARNGEALARQHCAGCHAIGTTGESPNPKSPPFRILSRRYPLDNLQEALAEGISVGHQGAEMPEFEFSPDEVDDLIEHMKRASRTR